MSYQADRLARRQNRIAGCILFIIILIFFRLGWQLVHIQQEMGGRLSHIAKRQHASSKPVPARRGLIFDRRGRILAGSRQVHSVFADPLLIEDLPDTARRIAPILEMDPGYIEELIRDPDRAPRFRWLCRLIEDPQADAIKEMNLPGIGLVEEHKRSYPYNNCLAQVIGTVNIDEKGQEGLELKYDEHLTGEDGSRATIRDARRHAIGVRLEDTYPPTDGGHVLLTIDAVVQEIAERHLQTQIDAFDAKSGVAIVMAVKTGEILAMANYPTFDPNHRETASQDARRNRCVVDPVEPGSIFKPIIASGALKEKIVNKTQTIDCQNGLYRVQAGGRTLRDVTPRGALTLKEIVTFSSNIGMGIIGERMGDEKLYTIVRNFGFGSSTQSGLPGENRGWVFPLNRWQKLSSTSIPMGYELVVTPLQMAAAFSALANKGVLLRPRVVLAKTDSSGNVLESYEEPEVIRKVVPESIADYMVKEVLTNVIKVGTGKRVRLDEYEVFGKSGTAKLTWPKPKEPGRKRKKGYEPGAYQSSFIGGAPADDPEIVVVVMIRRPDSKKGYYGGTVSGPAVREIIRETLAYLGEPPRKEE